MLTSDFVRRISPRGALGALLGVCLAALSAYPGDAHAAAPNKGKATTGSVSYGSNSLLGSYLAGHVARSARDSENAALYYRRALQKDPSNSDILDDAFQLDLASGEFESAKTLALRLIKRPGEAAIAYDFLGLDAFKRKDYAKADEYFRLAAKGTSPEEPTMKLARAWVAVAQGQADRAIAILSQPSKAAWATHFETVQRAFVADVAKKKAAAAEAYKTVYEKKPTNMRIAEGYARHLAVWGDRQQALDVLKESGAEETPLGSALAADLKAGRTPKLMVSTVDEGLAETFLGIGQVLASNNGVDAAQIYLRLALYLNPASEIAKLELAEIYGNLEHYHKAVAVLDGIRETSPFRLNAQVRKALYLNALQKTDEATALLAALAEKHPKEESVLQTLASIDSAAKRYDAAIPYYTRVIELIGEPEKRHWSLFYQRGIAYERTKQWARAEADFKRALDLDPEQGAVLNYLGYSWLDQNINIPEAFELIKKAVRLKPNDGYIIDSLGWGYYIQKDYEQAVKHLDKAVELRPEDPTLNDHLGDVYWRLGRKLEAKFQWTQALSLNPEPEDVVKIKKKLEAGLPDEAGPHAELQTHPEAVPGVASEPQPQETANP
ncbi:tetratricopeptide repeat protein [Rhodomicrobium sp.]|uniref:tetratricopeptide repeat protein n=1 Tax=Rhodomicrobium sp. TaxID=2720632 RepID=UPI0039E38A04